MKINLFIEKIQNGQAVLRDEKGRLINWPSDSLPAGAREGDKTAVNIGEENKNLAKDILNEILNSQ
jgi:hypothetical protein